MRISVTQTHLVLLPPAREAVPKAFYRVTSDPVQHDKLFAQMQRLRGSIYLRDGAIEAKDLTLEGRHQLSVDRKCWHLLTLDEEDQVCGCLRYLEERNATGFNELWIRHSALSWNPQWGAMFQGAVEKEIALARQRQVAFGEVGGWAIAECRRCTLDSLRMVLATCGLFRMLGGCIGVATATVRHGSAAILRRIGLEPLCANGTELPPYYDPRYGCEMEALRFDSDYPNPKYAEAICALSEELAGVPVISRESKAAEWRVFAPGLELPGRYPVSPSALAPAAS